LFDGESLPHILASVLKDEPDLTAVPLKVRRLLRGCLEKDPKRRLQAIGDWRLLMDETSADMGARTPSRMGRLAMIAALVAVAVAAVAVSDWWRALRPVALKPPVRLDIDLGSDVSLGSIRGTDAVFSPDGTRLLYVSQGKLFTRKLDQLKGTELPGTEGAFAPFFSPDGQWVAFFTPGKLKKVSVEGGAPVVLCSSSMGMGGSWNEDGSIIVSLLSTGALSQIPSSGGTPTPVTELATPEITHRWPQVLPGGKAVLFTSNRSATGFDGANIEIVSLKDRRRKTLQRSAVFGRYMAAMNGAGYLLYVTRGTLFAVAFNLDALEVRGTPVQLQEQVAYSTNNGSAQFDFPSAPSGPGTLVYRRGETAGGEPVTVQWLNAGGRRYRS
jgi:hypothetical protein